MDYGYEKIYAIYKTRQDALNALQEIYEKCSKEAEEYNKNQTDLDDWYYAECHKSEDWVGYYSDFEDEEYKLFCVSFGEQIELGRLV